MENNKDLKWMPYEEHILQKKWMEELAKGTIQRLWQTGEIPKMAPREDNNIKLAWVINMNGGREMLGVDNKTMKGYAMREDVPTWKLPLESVEYDTFERWCTTFDI